MSLDPVFKALLEGMKESGASDLHIKVGSPPVYRIDGELKRLAMGPLGPEDVDAILNQSLGEREKQTLESENQVDFALSIPKVARFRANVHRQRGTIAMTLRMVPYVIPTIESLNLPPVLADLALLPRGLVLVTGTVGSGKSTTLAAMIDVINTNRNAKVITIEDPIEYLHSDKKGLLIQREVGDDTPSYSSALKHVLRQDPNVILIGEIRDVDTMSIALTAANTGHLVLSTLHTIDAMQTVNRIISFFPIHQHQEVRFLLASCLQSVVSLRLVRRANGKGRVPAVEVMITTGAIREYLMDPEKIHMIKTAIAEGVTEYGMQAFDQSLMKLYKEGTITLDEAVRNCSNPTEFDLRVRGIEATTDNTWSLFEGKR
jgi:twitching motility protein PilT